jgi:exonuclease VII large subunit
MEYKNEQIASQKENLNFFYKKIISQKELLIEFLFNSMDLKKPTLGTKKYFAQVIKEGKTVELERLKMGDIFELQTQNTALKAKVIEIIPDFAKH